MVDIGGRGTRALLRPRLRPSLRPLLRPLSSRAWIPVALVGAVVLAGCGGGDGLATITSVVADGPELRVGYRTTDCAESVQARVVSETTDAVTLEVAQVGGGECDDVTAPGFTSVELTEVLGSRSVIDESTGASVKVEFATA